MRLSALAILLLATAACSAPKKRRGVQPPIKSLPAEITFDGADAKDVPASCAWQAAGGRTRLHKGATATTLQGNNVTEDDPNFGDMNAPNLTLPAR